MSKNHIQNSSLVRRLQRVVDGYDSQRLAAEALGNINYQSSISNAINGVRLPSKGLRKALEVYESQHHMMEPRAAEAPSNAQELFDFLIELPIERTTHKFHLFKVTSDDGFIVSVYAPKARMGSNPPKNISAAVKLNTA